MNADTPCGSDELACFPLFEGVDQDQLAIFLRDHRILGLPASHQLVFEGDWSDGLFLIRSGIAKVRHLSLSGDETVISLMGAGDTFGELAMILSSGRRTADVVTLTPMEVVKLRLGPVQQAIHSSPRMAISLARLQTLRLRSLGHRLQLRGEDATTRVLATLLELARCVGHDRDPRAPIPDLSQSEIATIAGLARGTTSKVINQLRARNTISDGPPGLRILRLEPLQRRGLLDAEG